MMRSSYVVINLFSKSLQSFSHTAVLNRQTAMGLTVKISIDEAEEAGY
jgi:hypothetical protein